MLPTRCGRGSSHSLLPLAITQEGESVPFPDEPLHLVRALQPGVERGLELLPALRGRLDVRALPQAGRFADLEQRHRELLEDHQTGLGLDLRQRERIDVAGHAQLGFFELGQCLERHQPLLGEARRWSSRAERFLPRPSPRPSPFRRMPRRILPGPECESSGCQALLLLPDKRVPRHTHSFTCRHTIPGGIHATHPTWHTAPLSHRHCRNAAQRAGRQSSRLWPAPGHTRRSRRAAPTRDRSGPASAQLPDAASPGRQGQRPAAPRNVQRRAGVGEEGRGGGRHAAGLPASGSPPRCPGCALPAPSPHQSSAGRRGRARRRWPGAPCPRAAAPPSPSARG